MAVITEIDFRGWFGYRDIILEIQRQTPAAQLSWLRQVMGRYNKEIQAQILNVGIQSTTGTYARSMGIFETGGLGNPTIVLAIEPRGRNADRLPIYWKVLEFGARPNERVPLRPIVQWASQKFGADFLTASKIRSAIRTRGIQRHPILQRIFVLTPPDGAVTSLTALGLEIAEQEAQLMMDRLTRIMVTPITRGVRAGRGVVFQRPAGSPGGTGGQFTSPR